MADESHPVRDIVLPLGAVLAFSANLVFSGIAWGRLTKTVEQVDENQSAQTKVLEKLTERVDGLRDRVRDLEKDAERDRIEFLKLEDYTRGRIDRLPYHAPPTARR